MNNKKKLSILLLILLLLGLLTAAVLASRLRNMNKNKDDGTTISIGDDARKVSNSDGEDVPLEADLVVKRDLTMFCTYYEDGHVTVRSAGGDKVIAPGTKWDYKFSVMNNKSASLDYEMYMTVTVECENEFDYFPVQGRLKGPEKWLFGSAKKYIPLKEVGMRVDEGVLAAGHVANYKFGWKWPFEGNDELDTMLGNLTAETPITVKIVIWIYAWNDEIPDKPGGERPSPPTGDDFNIAVWMTVMVLSLFAFVAVLAKDRKEQSKVQSVLARVAEKGEEKRE